MLITLHCPIHGAETYVVELGRLAKFVTVSILCYFEIGFRTHMALNIPASSFFLYIMIS